MIIRRVSMVTLLIMISFHKGNGFPSDKYFIYTEVCIMVIQHNLTAMNANRMLNVTTSAQSKSAEKLSSGYKINRAADDAAGLSISEKMRKQITRTYTGFF